MPTVSKIYVRCLYDQKNEYFQPLFSKLQCGFHKGHSAQHCLLVLIEKYRKVLDKRGFAGLLLTDLSKAFDCIDHELIIAKLSLLNIFIPVFMTKSKELKLTLHLAIGAM